MSGSRLGRLRLTRFPSEGLGSDDGTGTGLGELAFDGSSLEPR